MTKPATYALAIGAVVVVLLVAFGRDLLLRRSGEIACDDGVRRRMDEREFSTQYWAYDVQFEGSLGDKAKFSTKLEPKILQELSESRQSAKDFQKLIVNGFNGCAISKAQFAAYSAKFQALDSLSRQIDAANAKSTPSAGDQAELSKLVDQYIETAKGLSSTH